MFWALDGEVFEYRRLFQTDPDVSFVEHKPSKRALDWLIERAERGDRIIIESREPLDTLEKKFGAIPRVILVGEGRTCLSRVVTEVAERTVAQRRQYEWRLDERDRENALFSHIFELCGEEVPKELVCDLAGRLRQGGCTLAVNESLSDRLRRKCHSGWAKDFHDRQYFSDEEHK